MSTDLDTEVRAALESRRGDWLRIADKAGVSHSWISQFVRLKIPNPGFETLKRLHAVLFSGEAAQPAPIGPATSAEPGIEVPPGQRDVADASLWPQAQNDPQLLKESDAIAQVGRAIEGNAKAAAAAKA